MLSGEYWAWAWLRSTTSLTRCTFSLPRTLRSTPLNWEGRRLPVFGKLIEMVDRNSRRPVSFSWLGLSCTR